MRFMVFVEDFSITDRLIAEVMNQYYDKQIDELKYCEIIDTLVRRQLRIVENAMMFDAHRAATAFDFDGALAAAKNAREQLRKAYAGLDKE